MRNQRRQIADSKRSPGEGQPAEAILGWKIKIDMGGHAKHSLWGSNVKI